MILIQHNQNLLDLAIQEAGNVFAVFEFAINNGINITDELNIGDTLYNTSSNNLNNLVVEYFKKNNTKIATNNKQNQKNNMFLDDFPYSF